MVSSSTKLDTLIYQKADLNAMTITNIDKATPPVLNYASIIANDSKLDT